MSTSTATATTHTSTLSLHDALPIFNRRSPDKRSFYRLGLSGDGTVAASWFVFPASPTAGKTNQLARSEEHTSELQSRLHLVCRLLLEKKKENSKERQTNVSARQVYA